MININNITRNTFINYIKLMTQMNYVFNMNLICTTCFDCHSVKMQFLYPEIFCLIFSLVKCLRNICAYRRDIYFVYI